MTVSALSLGHSKRRRFQRSEARSHKEGFFFKKKGRKTREKARYFCLGTRVKRVAIWSTEKYNQKGSAWEGPTPCTFSCRSRAPAETIGTPSNMRNSPSINSARCLEPVIPGHAHLAPSSMPFWWLGQICEIQGQREPGLLK